ncbi:MAG: hypothetical protein ACI865_000600 [Flavobacteriaceae bacterium]|jgi:hypothetical protein
MRYILFTLAIALLIFSCKKENTVWETDWSAPILNDTLSLRNLVNDSTLTESGGFYEVDLNRSLFDININDLVKFPDTTIAGQYGIAFAFITIPPGYTFVNDEQEVELTIEDIQLKEIIVSEGFIDITVSNPVGTRAFFNIGLPGISKDGVPFSQTYSAEAGTNANPGVAVNTIDLSGYVLNLTGTDGTKRNTLRSVITVNSDPLGSEVGMTSSDIVHMDVSLRGVEINYARGYFGNQIISDTTDVDLDAIKLIQSGAIDLPATTIKFEIENGVKVGASALLNFVKNENDNGSIVSLTHPQLGSAFNIDPASGSWASLTPSQKLLIFDDANSNIETFLENVGSKNSIGYRIELNPWGNVSGGTDEIFPNSRLNVNLHVNMPLKIGADALVVRDTFAIDLTQNVDKTHVVSGELLLTTSNAFPFSADVKLVMLDANMNVIHSVIGSEKIESAQYGALSPASGLFVANSNVRFVLSDAMIADVENIKFVIIESQFNSMNPITSLNELMSIPVGAFLSVKLRTRFTTENQF